MRQNLNLLRIATRQSALALWQAEFVKSKLQTVYPNLQIEILGLKTKGDTILDIPLHKTGGKGLFVKELEDALLENKADIAVHSMKDVPAYLPEGLEITTILEREDPREAFLCKNQQSFVNLESNARIGTSSLRRKAQLAAKRPDLCYEDLRGNVDTRVQKLEKQAYDAIILAVAGLKRLNLQSKITSIFEPDFMLPCIGQGALGIECRQDDEDTKKMLTSLHHLPTAQCILAERSLNQRLGGSCQLPVGGLATFKENSKDITLTAMVGMPDGSRILQAQMTNPSQNAEALGIAVAEQLLAQGAKTIIDACISN